MASPLGEESSKQQLLSESSDTHGESEQQRNVPPDRAESYIVAVNSARPEDPPPGGPPPGPAGPPGVTADGPHQEAAQLLNKDDKENQEKMKGKMTGPLLFATLVCTLGSSFQMGYNIGVVNAPQLIVQRWINASHTDLFDPEGLSVAALTNIWSWTVSIFCVGGVVGGLTCGYIGDKFGRKGGMLINNVVAFIAAALMGFSKISNAYPLLILGRLFIGLNVGLNSGLAPMFLTEISPVNLRGALGSCHQLSVTVSILVSQILGMESLLGTEQLWPLLFALTALPAVFQVACLPFCPESPKYTLVYRGNAEQAEKDLIKLRKKTDVAVELEVMQDEANQKKNTPEVRFRDMFTDGALRWPLIIAVVMMMSQQFSGINVAMYYSTHIFKGAGLDDAGAQGATLGMGSINVIMTVISVVIVDRAGRRTLHIIGLSGMCVTTALLTVMLLLQKGGEEWASYCAVILVLLFVVSFATGPGSIPWFYVSELFQASARGHANAVAVGVNWISNFCVGLLFLPINNAIGEYTFLIFSAMLIGFILFTWKLVPETKGVSIETITAQFQERAKKR